MNPFQHARRGAMTAARIARVFAAAGGKCQGCGVKLRPGMDYDIDHIIPLSSGGTDDEDNLQMLCEGCHEIKTGGDISDAAKGKRRYTKHVVPKRFQRSRSWR